MLSTNLVKVFYVFSSEDEQSASDKKRLDQHFTFLREREKVHWQDYEFLPGTPLKDQVEASLKTADIILFLLSPDYLASYNYSREAELALARQAKGEAHVIPIILHSCDWRASKFRDLSPLPQNGEGIFPRFNVNKACLQVKDGINRVIDEWLIKREISPKIAIANTHYEQRSYEDALLVYKEALLKLEKTSFHQDKAFLLWSMGNALRKLRREEEALQIYLEALELAPLDPLLHKAKGEVLAALRRWESAIAAYDLSLKLISHPEEQPLAAQVYTNKGLASLELGKHEDALAAFNGAIAKDLNNARLYRYRGEVYFKLGDSEEAKASYTQAIALKPNDPYLRYEYGKALSQYKHFHDAQEQYEHFREAQEQYEEALRLKPDFARAYQHLSEVFSTLSRLAQEKYERLK